jgi:ribosome-binding factor A
MHVRVTADLRQATAFFMVHGADAAALARVREGLVSATGFLRRILAQRLKLRVTPMLRFEVDRVFEQEEKVDALLKEIADRDP